ncbi:MAG: branched-chain amino acid ABC transporter permease [Thermoproteota archaeon]|nr:MAG: branched-chain amino acid ABC transporter permease [Candidatus Korarchaeota archaeon]
MLGVLAQILAFGLVLGCIYSLAFVGLGLAWGVMHVINFAHGEWIMVTMYSTYWLVVLFNLDPYLIIPLNIAIGAVIGFVTQKQLIEPVLKGAPLSTILSTFGLSTLLIGIAQALWKQNFLSTPNKYIEVSVNVGGVRLSAAHIIAAIMSVAVMLGVYAFFKKTLTGKAILATSDVIGDPEVASLMGINAAKVRLLTLMLAGALTGIAGTLIATFYYVYPYVGLTWCLLGFVIVVLGGLGSFLGLFIAGIIVGVLEGVGSVLLGTAYSYLLVYAVFLLVLYVRPRGLMGRR